MAFADEKAAILAKVKAFGCDLYDKLDAEFLSYDDLPALIFANSNLFSCAPEYMRSLLDEIDAGELVSRGIYYKSSSVSSATNPLALIDSEFDLLTFDAGPVTQPDDPVPVVDIDGFITIPDPSNKVFSIDEVVILGKSIIKKIEVTSDTSIGTMSIGGGAFVWDIDAQKDEAGTAYHNQIESLRLVSCKGNAGNLFMIKQGSDIPNIRVDEGFYYGGFQCDDITGFCTDDIAFLTTSNETRSSIKLTWGLPTNSNYAKIGYRKLGDLDWMWVDTEMAGKFVNNGDNSYSYVFTELEKDTYYEFAAQNYCEDNKPSVPLIKQTLTKSY